MTASNEADTTKTIIILLILSLVLSKAALMSLSNCYLSNYLLQP